MIGFIFSCYLLLVTFATPSYAQAPSSPSSNIQSQNPASNFQLPTSISPTSPLYTDLLVHNMFHTFSCLAVGQSVTFQPCLTYQITKNAQGAIQGIPVLSQVNLSGGTLGAVTGLIGGLYQNPPVRTANYLASIGENLGLVKEAHARVEGSGAKVLEPIIKLWQVSRNIAYVIMIIIFVVIGLMVMFRQRINPQTVITAQAAIPGLVIGLILITFSYFLAGLISDTAFIGTNLVGAYFSAVRGEASNPQNLVGDISNSNILQIFAPFTRMMDVGKIVGILNPIWDSLGDASTEKTLLQNIGAFLDPTHLDPQRVIRNLAMLFISQIAFPIGNMFGGWGQAAAAVGTLAAGQFAGIQLVGFALTFVAILMLLYAMFRLLLRLINNYLTIIFLTITAPFQFLAAALPGRQGIATNWILNMLANILAFPAVLAVLYFVAFLLGPQFIQERCPDTPTSPCPFKVSQLNQTESNSFMSTAQAADTNNREITGNAIFPLLGGFDFNLIKLLLAFGALTALPAIPDIIQRSIGTLSQAGQMIGQEIGGSTAAGQRYTGQFQQGVSGFAGQVGRLTTTVGYSPDFDEAGNIIGYRPNPLQSQTGLFDKWGYRWNKRFGKKPPLASPRPGA